MCAANTTLIGSVRMPPPPRNSAVLRTGLPSWGMPARSRRFPRTKPADSGSWRRAPAAPATKDAPAETKSDSRDTAVARRLTALTLTQRPAGAFVNGCSVHWAPSKLSRCAEGTDGRVKVRQPAINSNFVYLDFIFDDGCDYTTVTKDTAEHLIQLGISKIEPLKKLGRKPHLTVLADGKQQMVKHGMRLDLQFDTPAGPIKLPGCVCDILPNSKGRELISGQP